MSTVDNTCVVCFKNVDIFSIGVCDHPVCYECSTRMRVLCRQNECPICRQDLPKVIFTRKIQPYKELARKSFPSDKEFKILFDGGPGQKAFETLLQHECHLCTGTKSYQNFQLLKDHMRKKHELFYCELCVDNLKIFSHERRVYTRQDLAHHRRKGDVDDRSHKGHPLCEFCDQRYMDSDELFRHLRKDHLFCHFCDADGFHQYYSSYDYLREHFRKEHFLCEEGSCYEEKFTSAFRSEIDLKAHRASSHCRSMGKQAAKQARTLEVEFTLAPRRDNRERNFRGNDRLVRRVASPVPLVCNHAGACNCNREDITTKPEISFDSQPSEQPRLNPNDFPTLGGSSSFSAVPSLAPSGSRGRGGAVMIRAGRPPLSITDENFPALSDSSPAPSHKVSSQVWLSVNSRSAQDRPSSAPTNFSIQVNRGQSTTNPPLGTMQTLSGRNMRLRGPVSSGSKHSELEDTNFPALKPLESYRGTSAEQWVSASNVDSIQNQVRNKVSTVSPAEAAHLLNGKQNIQQSSKKSQFVIEEDFPSLAPSSSSLTSSKPPNAKKASSVTIPMSNSWARQTRDNSPEKSSDSEAISNVANSKSKKKKKKAKNVNSTEGDKSQPLNKKVLSEQVSSNASSESSKKKKKSKQQSAQETVSNTDLSLNGNESLNQTKTNLANQENQDPTPDASQSNNGRKRSELQIESLQINESESSIEDTTNRLLSILRGDNYVPKSSDSSNISPPPGFGLSSEPVTSLKSAPPPGFSVKVNSVVRPVSSQLTFTSSSRESYPSLPASSLNQFVQPPDFQRRNTALMTQVIDLLRDQARQEQFRQKSILFRQGQLSSDLYYKSCVELMGEKAFNNCFPEMLVLLPEIERQHDLLNVYKLYNDGKSPMLRFEVCASCQQILAPSDLRVHASTHALENHFPALASNESSIQSSAWNRK